MVGGVRAAGSSLVVSGPDPVRVCALFQHLPGASWLAAGYEVRTVGEAAKEAGTLACRYLRRGSRFVVEAQGGAVTSADLAGTVTAKILDAVPGARVSSESPEITFRAAMDRAGGVVGVEVFRGPGGVPTGRKRVACLVSGGKHSAVLAWYAVLMGYAVTLVHVKSNDEGTIAAAKLYSELSHRADPRGLKLVVLEGCPVPAAVKAYVSDAETPVFGGFTASGSGPPEWARGVQQNPLFLLPEEEFEPRFVALGIGSVGGATDWGVRGDHEYLRKEFGGVTADVSEVLDRLG
ncbi:MAG: hypothetical protein JRN21_06365 [Nitrososphaerota archaeon]|nr:hypothetical protein [Nitrososphaerota archaeon]